MRRYLGGLPGLGDDTAALAAIARQTLAAVTETAEVVVGTFAETLPATLERLGAIDLAFIDGHHEEAATLRYVEAIEQHMSRGPIVLDDIHLYEGMWRAWQTLLSYRRFTAVNVGRFGLLVHGEGYGHSYDLSRYTGHWRVGPARKVGDGPGARVRC